MLKRRMDEEPEIPRDYERFEADIRSSDGILFVCPEYKGGIPGVLKNGLDLLPPQVLRRLPVSVCSVSAGGLGGAQVLSQLRLVALALGGCVTPESLSVSRVADGLEENFDTRAMALLEAMRFYMSAIARQKANAE